MNDIKRKIHLSTFLTQDEKKEIIDSLDFLSYYRSGEFKKNLTKHLDGSSNFVQAQNTKAGVTYE